jgi:hypothetical protein
VKLPFLQSVVPPHVFCLLEEGVTYARVRREAPPGFEEARHFRYAGGPLASGASGAPVVTREAVAEAVKAARALSGGNLKRASVIVPDEWVRVLPVELETMPGRDSAGREMVLWKLKKLIPGSMPEMELLYEPIPVLSEEKRVLVAAAAREAIDTIERAFEELGVRVGYLAPASLSLIEGLAPILAKDAGGDYALLHRSAGTLCFLILRGSSPIFFRQRPADGDEEHEREVRLSLSYYAERLKGPGLAAVYVHDSVPGRSLERISAFTVPPRPLTGALFEAAPDFDERLAARPELLPGFAAVYGK